MADRRILAGRISEVHKPAMTRPRLEGRENASCLDSESELDAASKRILQQQNGAHRVGQVGAHAGVQPLTIGQYANSEVTV